jgi:hypothetical protein
METPRILECAPTTSLRVSTLAVAAADLPLRVPAPACEAETRCVFSGPQTAHRCYTSRIHSTILNACRTVDRLAITTALADYTKLQVKNYR